MGTTKPLIEVRSARSTVVVTATCGLLLGFAATAGATWVHLDPDAHGEPFFWGFVAFAWAFVIYAILNVTRARTRLFEDRVERKDVFRTLVRSRRDIVGWRRLPNRSFLLVARDPAQSLPVTGEIALNPGWMTWLDSLPDLDACDRQQALDDPRLGDDVEQRSVNRAKVKRAAGAANALAIVVALWAMLWPRPYEGAVAAAFALPLAAYAVALRWPGLFGLASEDPSGVRLDLSTLLLLPSMAVALRAMLDIHLLDAKPALITGALAALPVWLVLLYVDRSARAWWMAIFSAFVVWGWAGGALVIANSLLDGAAPRLVQTQIVAKRGEPDDETTFDLQETGGSQERFNGVDVSSGAWAAAKVGDRRCVFVHPGLFGWRWLQRTDCASL